MDAETILLEHFEKKSTRMVQPEGFLPDIRVCRLKKFIYGLKQSIRVWNEELDNSLKSFGLHQSNKIRVSTTMYPMIMSTFKMNDIDEARYIFGIQITRDRESDKLWIDQEAYLKQMLIRFNMFDCNPVSTPMNIDQKLSTDMNPKTREQENEMSRVPYQEAIGCLLFASQVSRPDICFAVNFLSRFNNNPGNAHWMAVKRVFRYLRDTLSAKIEYKSDEKLDLEVYSDSDWASDIDERRSVTGYIFKFQSGPISWNSKKQPTIAISTTEAEYMAVTATVQESLWLNNLQQELIPKSPTCITIQCDNQGAINLGHTSIYHPRTKHIDVKHHFIRDNIKCGRIKLTYTPTDQMVADVMTKGLNRILHLKHVQAMGVKF